MSEVDTGAAVSFHFVLSSFVLHCVILARAVGVAHCNANWMERNEMNRIELNRRTLLFFLSRCITLVSVPSAMQWLRFSFLALCGT